MCCKDADLDLKFYLKSIYMSGVFLLGASVAKFFESAFSWNTTKRLLLGTVILHQKALTG